MSKINWKVRIKNKAFWAGLIPLVLIAIQIIASLFGIEIDLGDFGEKLLKLVNVIFAILALLGVVVDPTTSGVSDSEQAMNYIEPKED